MLPMDGEKKRKRTENGDFTGRVGRSKHAVETAVKEKEEETVVLPPPSEAEVDEFFAILRRMHVAVKYLRRNAQILPEVVNAHRSKLTASPTGSNGVSDGQKRAQGIVRKVGLDLNTLPDGGD